MAVLQLDQLPFVVSNKNHLFHFNPTRSHKSVFRLEIEDFHGCQLIPFDVNIEELQFILIVEGPEIHAVSTDSGEFKLEIFVEAEVVDPDVIDELNCIGRGQQSELAGFPYCDGALSEVGAAEQVIIFLGEPENLDWASVMN